METFIIDNCYFQVRSYDEKNPSLPQICYESIRKQINAYGNYTSTISNPIVSWVRKAGGNDMHFLNQIFVRKIVANIDETNTIVQNKIKIKSGQSDLD